MPEAVKSTVAPVLFVTDSLKSSVLEDVIREAGSQPIHILTWRVSADLFRQAQSEILKRFPSVSLLPTEDLSEPAQSAVRRFLPDLVYRLPRLNDARLLQQLEGP